MSARSKVKKGDFLTVVVDPRRNNGDDEAVALVTKVNDEGRVNLHVFLDTGDALRMSNIEVVGKRPDENDDEVETDASNVQRVAFKS
jgi:hypothetical protein